MPPASDPNPTPAPRDRAGTTRLAPGVHVPDAALRFTAARSSGPGGQNVNKRSTKVELRITLDELPLKPDARRRLRHLAKPHLTAAGELIITAQQDRSQRANKQHALDHLANLVLRALTPPKERIATKPTKGSKRRRLDAKKQRGQRKVERATKRTKPNEP